MSKKNTNLKSVNIFCSCGSFFELNLILDVDKLNIEVCNKCHPFYTGKQKIIDVAGRVDNFNKKFSKLKK
jgi:large subunit ribosomal protein L31